MTTPQDVRIPTDGDQIAAYSTDRKSRSDPAPCIVMAHGFTATRDDGLPAYAEAFREAGYVVVVFDYRFSAPRPAQPRQLVDISRQHADYHTVVAWARRLDGVDPDRIVVWGLLVQRRPRTGGRGGRSTDRRGDLPGAIHRRDRDPAGAADDRPGAIVAGMRISRRVAGPAAPPVAAVGDPGASRDDITRRPTRFRGDRGRRLVVAQRIRSAGGAAPGFDRPGRKTAQLRHAAVGRRLRERRRHATGPTIKAAHARHGRVRRYPYGHFDIYHDPQVKTDQLAFLRRVSAHDRPHEFRSINSS